MKKIILAVLVLALLGLLLNAQGKTAPVQKGSVKFQAVKSKGNYKMVLFLDQTRPVVYPIKAVKITYEPSHTIIFYLSDGTLSQANEESFLNKQKPIGKITITENDESGKPKPNGSLVEPKAKIEIKYPDQITKDTSAKIELLAEVNGKLQTHLVSTMPLKDSATVGIQAYYTIK
jgi:hypothetical protein